LALLLLNLIALAQDTDELRRLAEGFPAAQVEVGDVPNDDGSKVYISWPTDNPFQGREGYTYVVMAASEEESLKPIPAYSFSVNTKLFKRYQPDPLTGIGKSQFWGVKPPDGENPWTVVVSQL